jgi:DNA-binding beta-propeller fold protein YncE
MNVVGARLADFRMCVLAVLAICASACNLDNPGFTPPPGRITYPISLALSAQDGGAPRYLYVANSNFDLRYNAGSVHAYDLDELQRLLLEHDCREPPVPEPEDAGADPDGSAELDAGEELDADLDAGDELDADLDAGEELDADLDAGEELDADLDAGDELDADQPDAEADPDAGEPADAEADAADSRVPEYLPDADDFAPGTDTPRGRVCDGRQSDPEDESACCFGSQSALDRMRTSEVMINSYASALALSPDGEHLYVAVRGQTALLYLDVNGGELSCGEQGERCERGPKLGAKGETEDSEFEPQPTSIVTGTLGELGTAEGASRGYVATTHEIGSVSLFSTPPSGTREPGEAGKPHLLDTLSLQNNGVRRIASISKDPSGLLLVSSASVGVVLRMGARRPEEIAPNGGSGEDGERDLLQLYSVSSIAISGLSSSSDVRDVQADPRPVGEGQPQRLYALLRGNLAPFPNLIQSVVFLELPPGQRDGRFARVVDAVRVGNGPSKLEQLDLGQRHFLLASCYDEGSIYVIDADTRQIMTVIREISGPFDMQVDRARQLLYVGDFRASVIRVINLRGLVDRTAPLPSIVATIGAPTFTGGIK